MPKFASLLGLLLIAGCITPALAGKTQNVVLIVSDGLRWQEIFQGADPVLLDARNGGRAQFDAHVVRARGAAAYPHATLLAHRAGQRPAALNDETRGHIEQAFRGQRVN